MRETRYSPHSFKAFLLTSSALQYLYKVKYDDDRSVDIDMEAIYLGKVVEGDIVGVTDDDLTGRAEGPVLVAVVDVPDNDTNG